MSIAAPSAPRPFFQITGFTAGPVRTILALVLTAVVMQICLVPAREAARWIFRNGGEGWTDHVGLFVFVAIMMQGLVGLAGIAIMRKVLPAADGHVRWPPGRSYIGLAALIGVVMGLVMLVADYWPQLLAGTAPTDYPLEPVLAAEWLLAMITTGLGEETIFRGLLVGMLVILTPGRIRLGAFEIPIAGVFVALLFGIAHYDSFNHSPLHLAVAQQIYAFAWGLTYVWLMERSKSLVAPIVAHGVGNFVEVAAVMGLLIAMG
ncbi:CPBP family intramembrane glutamic endopeptidase [Brevundimonas sp.]|uniref:CPBP family intramembrane glutamic endopeptidase n=1 Tax=Brevundimonas sp. TaxID=1871086 RepID=UPI002D44B6DF|nr:CPBP family intramembrane glutamic endopeptidase [Brevundimonas sp.]HYC97590.1 CPBP family intramembrane glutamic endopeptidase [Brevundimonas sp.]